MVYFAFLLHVKRILLKNQSSIVLLSNDTTVFLTAEKKYI